MNCYARMHEQDTGTTLGRKKTAGWFDTPVLLRSDSSPDLDACSRIKIFTGQYNSTIIEDPVAGESRSGNLFGVSDPTNSEKPTQLDALMIPRRQLTINAPFPAPPMAAFGWVQPDAHNRTAQEPGRQSPLYQFLNILSLHPSLPKDSATRLLRQIHVLAYGAEDEAAIEFSLQSFWELVNFISSEYKRLRHPNIAVDRDGNFVASWTKLSKQMLTITFGPPNRWVATDMSEKKAIARSGTLAPGAFQSIPQNFRTWTEQ